MFYTTGRCTSRNSRRELWRSDDYSRLWDHPFSDVHVDGALAWRGLASKPRVAPLVSGRRVGLRGMGDSGPSVLDDRLGS